MNRVNQLLVPLLLFVVLLLQGGSARAVPEGYEPYAGPPGGAGAQASLYVVLAYSAIWLVLLLFVLSVWRRQQRVAAELEQLRQRLERRP